MKTLAFVIGLLIMLIGVTGIVWPEEHLRIAPYFLTPVGLGVAAAVRMGFGLVFFFAAPASRAPKTLRVLGVVIVIAGIATALLGVERARAFLDWWTAHGLAFLRMGAGVALAAGSFIAYATAPRRP
jgi:drug/metabolite transporter (DMT)-like permease